jgi:hypothetical protein
MRSMAKAMLLLASCAPASSAMVRAPLVAGAPSHYASHESASPAPASSLKACADPWAPDSATERVVIVCGGDVRREGFDETGEIARAITPALDPARERVCACASRATPPPHVDLSVRAIPDEGRATVEIADPEEDLDPTLGPEFAACFGTVVATFSPFHLAACAAGGNAIVIYPVRVDLGS